MSGLMGSLSAKDRNSGYSGIILALATGPAGIETDADT
jgi:hypothetical protein